MDKLLQLYIAVLKAHIQTKTTDSQFHEKSQEFYELLFDVFHTIAEKRQDLDIDKEAGKDVYQDTYENIEEAKGILEAMLKEKNSVGMDNLIRSHIDSLESTCGNAWAFID